MFIYLIKNNLNNKYYVGQTTQSRVERRWQSHCHLKKNLKNPPLISLAISKYGKENFTFTVIAVCSSQSELDELEKKYINEYNSLAPNGYNLMDGGVTGCVFNDETLQKMSKAKLGKSLSKETKKKMSDSHKSRCIVDSLSKQRSNQTKEAWKDPAYRDKISSGQHKRWQSEDNRIVASIKAKEIMTDSHKSLISDKVKEALLRPETKAKLQAAHKRQQKRIVDDLGNQFESIKSAAEFHKLNGTSAIIKQIKGIYKTAGGRTFKYLDQSLVPALDSRPTVYLVSGVSGSGKSWVCEQLLDKFTYVSYDKNSKSKHLELLKQSSGKPKLYDPPIKISTFIRRHSDMFNIRPVFIIEEESVIRARLMQRGGVFTDSATKRISAIRSRSKKYGIFSGTSSQVLAYLQTIDI